MRRSDLIAFALVFCVSSASGVARAASFQNSTGLASPGTTITFSEVILTPAAALTNQYAGLGVTFSTGSRWSPVPGGPPNVDDYNVGNFHPSGSSSPISIFFSQPVSAAAFAVASGYLGTLSVTAKYLGAVVEPTSMSTNSSQTNNFVGFTGIVFDEIRLSQVSQDRTFLLDNLQFTAVPEPGTALLLMGGLIGTALRRRV